MSEQFLKAIKPCEHGYIPSHENEGVYCLGAAPLSLADDPQAVERAAAALDEFGDFIMEEGGGSLTKWAAYVLRAAEGEQQ